MEGVQAAYIWGIGIVVFAFGVGLGFFASWAMRPGDRRLRELEGELDRTREEMEEYRAGVNRHFERTSELFQELTDTYKNVYTHLASGARELCGEQSRPALDMPDARLPAGDRETPSAAAPDPASPEAHPTAHGSDDGDSEALGDSPRVPDLEADAPAADSERRRDEKES